MGNQLKHHQVFDGIQLWAGPIPSGYDVDFLGTHIRRYYDEDISPEHKNRPDQTTSAGLPPFDAEYFEWIDLLESVKNAKGKQYIFVELGAGYGRWSVRAAQAIRRLNPMPFKIIAVGFRGSKTIPGNFSFAPGSGGPGHRCERTHPSAGGSLAGR